MALIQLLGRQRCMFARVTTVELACSRNLRSLCSTKLGKDVSNESFNLYFKPQEVATWKRVFSASTRQDSYIRKEEYRLPEQGKRKQDNIPEGYQIVYESDYHLSVMLSLALPTVVVLLGTSIVFVAVMIFGYEIPDSHRQELYYMAGGSMFLFYATFLLPVIMLRQRCVVRMYHDKTSEEFIAVLRKNIFQTEKVTFKMNEAKGSFDNKSKCNFMINGRACQVYEKDFEKYGHTYLFNKWFGFD